MVVFQGLTINNEYLFLRCPYWTTDGREEIRGYANDEIDKQIAIQERRGFEFIPWMRILDEPIEVAGIKIIERNAWTKIEVNKAIIGKEVYSGTLTVTRTIFNEPGALPISFLEQMVKQHASLMGSPKFTKEIMHLVGGNLWIKSIFTKTINKLDLDKYLKLLRMDLESLNRLLYDIYTQTENMKKRLNIIGQKHRCFEDKEVEIKVDPKTYTVMIKLKKGYIMNRTIIEKIKEPLELNYSLFNCPLTIAKLIIDRLWDKIREEEVSEL